MLRVPPKFLELDNIKISTDNIFMDLHTSVLYDKRIEEIKKMFIKKYNIDVMSIFVTNEKSTHCLLQHHTDSWNEYNRISFFSGLQYNIFYQETGKKNLKKFFNLNSKNHEGVEYATITDSSSKGMSSDIIGRKLHGYAFYFYNELNGNKIQYIIAFKNKNIQDISYSTYISLINDFRKAQTCLDVFLRYYEMYGKLDNSPLLASMIEQEKFNITI